MRLMYAQNNMMINGCHHSLDFQIFHYISYFHNISEFLSKWHHETQNIHLNGGGNDLSSARTTENILEMVWKRSFGIPNGSTLWQR